MKLVIYLRDPRTSEKSQLEYQGDGVKLDESLDGARDFVKKHHLEIVDWKLDMEKGQTAKMDKEPCTACGAKGATTFNKIDRNPEGIIVSTIHLSLCPKCSKGFREDPKERVRLMTLGLQTAVIFPSRIEESTQ